MDSVEWNGLQFKELFNVTDVKKFSLNLNLNLSFKADTVCDTQSKGKLQHYNF